MKYQKGSFITVPSRDKLRGLHPTAQALYMWLCAYANESSTAYPSRTTLAKDCGVSPRNIDSMAELLLKEGLIERNPRYKNNEQLTNLYTVLVKEGMAGIATPLAESATPPSQDLRTELNPVLTQSNTSESEIRVVPEEKETEPRSKTKPKYPKARTAFSWFPRVEPSWSLNTTELKHGELLFLRGERQVKTALRFVNEHKGEEYFPTVTKPSDLERKWKDIVSKQKK